MINLSIDKDNKGINYGICIGLFVSAAILVHIVLDSCDCFEYETDDELQGPETPRRPSPVLMIAMLAVGLVFVLILRFVVMMGDDY